MQRDRQHRLGDGRGAQPDAGVVPPGGDDVDGLAGDVDGAARHLDAGGGLERDLHDDVLAGGDAAEDAAGMVRREARRRQLVAMLAAALRRNRDAVADLHRLHGVDAHHRVRDVGIEAVEHRLAQADRHAAARSR